MNYIFSAALILWVISGAAYRRSRRGLLPKVTITPLSIEDQLDIDVHRTQITERPHFKPGTWDLESNQERALRNRAEFKELAGRKAS